MASIKCTNCGAVLKTANPIAAGKKIKCPKCTKVFVVEDEEEKEEELPEEEDTGADEKEPAPKSKKPMKASKDDEDEESDEDEEEEQPKKKGKPKTGDGEPKKKGSSLMLIVIGGVLLVCCIGCGSVGWLAQATIKGLLGFADAVNKDLAKLNKDKDKTEKKVPLTPEFKLTSEELAKEFTKDEAASEAKYKDKVLEVTGEVTDVGPTLDQIMLKGAKKNPKDFNEFRIRLGIPPDQQGLAARFSKGQKIKAVGKYLSLTNGAWLTITDCTLTEVDKSKTIVISAEELAKEFEKNEDGAKAKFAGNDIVVTGQVVDIKTDKDGTKLAVLKGTAKTNVAVTIGGLMQTEVAKGQSIEVRAMTDGIRFQNNEVQLTSRMIISAK